MSPEDRLGETGALLLKRNVFTSKDLQALASIGVDTPEALLAMARDPEQRPHVALDLDLSEGDLITAGMVARLLAIQGPGGTLARRVAEEADLAPCADPEGRESMQELLKVETPDFLQLWTEVFEDNVKERARNARRIGNRNRLWLWLALGIVFPAAVFWSEWNGFFMPTRGENVLLVVRDFVRRGIWLEVGLALVVSLGLFMIAELPGAICGFLPLERLTNRGLTWRDRLIAIETFTLLPPRQATIVEWLKHNLLLPLVTIIVIFVVATRSIESNLTARWAAYLILVGVAILALLMFVLQAQAFSRLAETKVSWVSPTRERYAEAQVFGLPLAFGISALLIYVAIVPVFRGGLGALSSWNEHQQARRTAAFERSLDQLQFAPDQQAEWTAVRSDWIAWSQQQANAASAAVQSASEETLRAVEIIRRTLVSGLLGLLLAVALAEYLYASRPKGALNLGIWATALVASEYLPDRIARTVGVPEDTAIAVILGLALAATAGVVGELGMAWRGRNASRVCPNPECFAEIAPEANFCQNCGATLWRE